MQGSETRVRIQCLQPGYSCLLSPPYTVATEQRINAVVDHTEEAKRDFAPVQRAAPPGHVVSDLCG